MRILRYCLQRETRPSVKLEVLPLSAVHSCIFSIFASALHIWMSFLLSQPEEKPAMPWLRAPTDHPNIHLCHRTEQNSSHAHVTKTASNIDILMCSADICGGWWPNFISFALTVSDIFVLANVRIAYRQLTYSTVVSTVDYNWALYGIKTSNRTWKGKGKGKGKVHPCTGTEALYRPYGPLGD